MPKLIIDRFKKSPRVVIKTGETEVEVPGVKDVQLAFDGLRLIAKVDIVAEHSEFTEDGIVLDFGDDGEEETE